jgi:hypothetical protein
MAGVFHMRAGVKIGVAAKSLDIDTTRRKRSFSYASRREDRGCGKEPRYRHDPAEAEFFICASA